MTGFDEEDDEELQQGFPLSDEEREQVAKIIGLVRNHLFRLSTPNLRSASVLLYALERLPLPTDGVHVVFGFRTPSIDGNWGWADIKIDSDEFRLGVGEHFYDPSVGGDTEVRTIFQAFAGGVRSEGDIGDWLETASYIFSDGIPDIEDYSDYDVIDWDLGTEDQD